MLNYEYNIFKLFLKIRKIIKEFEMLIISHLIIIIFFFISLCPPFVLKNKFFKNDSPLFLKTNSRQQHPNNFINFKI